MGPSKRTTPGARFRSVRLIAASWGCLVFFRVAVSVAGYNAANRLLDNASPKTQTTSQVFAQRVAIAINQAARYAPRATCLIRAMAAKFLLDRKSVNSTLCVGVSKETDAPLKAHAWLKSGNLIVVGDEEDQLSSYTTLVGN